MVKAEILLIVLMSLVSGSIQNDDRNYDPNKDGVVELTKLNFKSEVLNSDDAWLIIYDWPGPGCKICAEYSKAVKKAFPLLKEKKIKVGFVDNTTPEGKALIVSYQITMFPSLYIFGHDKADPINSPISIGSGEQIANEVEFLLKQPPAAQGQCGKDSVQNVETNTYELTDENFDEVLMKCEEEAWMVNFYSPGVEPCVEFAPFFEAAAKEFKGRVKFGSFYQLGSKVAKQYGIVSRCTVKLFPAGNKNRQPVDYNNGRHGPFIHSNLIPWIKNFLAAGKPAPDINELTSQSVLDTKCKSSGVACCIFFFTPTSAKCNSECQRTYSDQLKQIANDTKAENWAWFLTTEGKQPEFEKTFGMTSFPGVVAVDLQSKTFSTKGGTNTATKTKEYIESFSNGIVPTKNLPSGGLPAVKA